MKPTVLLTNDDGIGTAFLHALVAACQAEGFRVKWKPPAVMPPASRKPWSVGRPGASKSIASTTQPA
ncbi:MAG: hypothetical protein EBR62_00275 [Verrucomicrobia bacterium]|nr:hypothetical protein [Verrucomicrobiota bacterium]